AIARDGECPQGVDRCPDAMLAEPLPHDPLRGLENPGDAVFALRETRTRDLYRAEGGSHDILDDDRISLPYAKHYDTRGAICLHRPFSRPQPTLGNSFTDSNLSAARFP